MSLRFDNFIAREWMSGDSEIENRISSDTSDLIGYVAPASAWALTEYGLREQGRYAAEFHTTVKTAYVFAGEPLVRAVR